jgi:hypothetical protein
MVIVIEPVLSYMALVESEKLNWRSNISDNIKRNSE